MEKQIKYWDSLSKKIKDPVETKNKRPDTSGAEIEFLTQYLRATNQVLDLGAGSGVLTNKIIPLVSHITAVEYFEGFSKFINESDKVLVINANLSGFKIRKTYDVVLMTGVAQCFAEEDAATLYRNAASMVKRGSGIFINRVHCGLKEDILVDGWSEELQTDYFASYRQVDKEVKMMRTAGFASIERFDFLPNELNVWDNSRHFYFVCKID